MIKGGKVGKQSKVESRGCVLHPHYLVFSCGHSKTQMFIGGKMELINLVKLPTVTKE